ncbi:hypothetical protein [Clostridium sp. HBUAS56017]|uniref:hypothetical protein n=1 Tax=Clostridium sp. HBUAS56017 TaxID=2571128 RepID=UPI0011773DB6|nr:hypothetical protein [Clostridium sp. HBUAS56017]
MKKYIKCSINYAEGERMKGFKRAKYRAFIVVLCSLFLMSCESHVEKKVDGVKLEKGAIIQNEGGIYSNYNLHEGSFNKIENDEIISLFDSKSGNYITQKDGKYSSYYLGKVEELKGVKLEDIDLKLSPNGKYLSYFRKEENILKLNIISLKDGSLIEIKSNVAISDTYLDWVDEDTIIYYGISEDRVNGVFKYNVSDEKEDLFYKLDGGIVQFVKNIQTGVICIEETIDNVKVVKFLDKDGTEKGILPPDITYISDIITDGTDYYFLGKVKGNNNSLYRIHNNIIKRMVFDFPAKIDYDKGLSMDSKGNILFIGSSSKNSKNEEIYKVTKEGSISEAKASVKEYAFVKYQ